MRGLVWDGSRLVATEDLQVRPPGPGEVTVRVHASGICHSDLNLMDGQSAWRPPVVPGHEAAGVIESLGPGVADRHVGEPVVVATMRPCGTCRMCTTGRAPYCATAYDPDEAPFTLDGRPVRMFAHSSSFAELVTVAARQAMPAEGVPPTEAALLCCAVSTGFGSVRNLAGVRPGDAVVVTGVGGVGVNALQGARLLRAGSVLAVDIDPAREEIARRFGATDFLAVPTGTGPDDMAAAVAARVGDRVDAVVECSGALSAIGAAVRLPGPGGVAVLVGMPAFGATVPLDIREMQAGRRRIVTGLNGSVDPVSGTQELVGLARDGKLDLAGQVTRVWPFAEAEQALAAVRAGSVVRAVLDMTA